MRKGIKIFCPVSGCIIACSGINKSHPVTILIYMGLDECGQMKLIIYSLINVTVNQLFATWKAIL